MGKCVNVGLNSLDDKSPIQKVINYPKLVRFKSTSAHLHDWHRHLIVVLLESTAARRPSAVTKAGRAVVAASSGGVALVDMRVDSPLDDEVGAVHLARTAVLPGAVKPLYALASLGGAAALLVVFDGSILAGDGACHEKGGDGYEGRNAHFESLR